MNKELLIYSFKILPFKIIFNKFKRKIFNKFKINFELIEYDITKIDDENFDINFKNFKIFNLIKEYYLDHLSDLTNQEILNRNINIVDNFMNNKITIFNNIYDFSIFTDKTYNLDYYSIFNYDFINNYKWERKENHKIIGNNGYDIKVPWEIGRLQFLSYITTTICIYKELKIQNVFGYDSKIIVNKIIDFIIGFIENNSTKLSIQWLSAMDVSIRLSNIIYILDSLSNSGINIESTKIELIKKSIYEHIKYVIIHLEWSEGMRANHYYSNLTGLFYAFNYLIPKNDLTRQEIFSFKKFLISQIIKETKFQFNEDGSNFEDSIPYHTLSFEFLLFNLILLNTLNEAELSEINSTKTIPNVIEKKDNKLTNDDLKSFNERLFAILKFTQNINNNGLVPQIGDNDSGTFINFDILNNTQSNQNKISLNYNSLDIKHRLIIFEKTLNLFEQNNKRNSLTNTNIELINCNNIFNFPNFGIILNKSEELYFTLKYSQLGQLGKGGHSHNDCLSFVLSLFGEEIFSDIGTYSYTKDYKLRNKYRSNKNHNVLTSNDLEQNNLFDRNLDDMFWIYSKKYDSKLISFNENIIISELKNQKYHYKRAFLFKNNNINCKEEINSEGEKNVNFLLAPKIKITEVNESYLIFEKLLNDNKEKIICKLSIDIDKNLSSEINKNSNDLSIDDYEYSPHYLNKVISKKIIITSHKNIINWELTWKKVQL